MSELNLGLQLEMFAQSNQATRERVLPHILRGIKSSISPETISTMFENPHTPNIAPDLVRKTLDASFIEIPSDMGREVYTGEGTAVIISADGKLLGWYENCEGPVHLKHGIGEQHSLLQFAMVKSVRRLHLELIGDSKYKGGIVNRNNWDYLKSISMIADGTPLFEGDAVQESGEGSNKKTAAVIGVSGALAAEEFMNYLTGGTVEKYELGMFAGMMDTIAASAMVDILNNKKPPFYLPERATLLTRSH